jgi:hypothetical protein
MKDAYGKGKEVTTGILTGRLKATAHCPTFL